MTDNQASNQQEWNIKKIFYYLIYTLFAKHLPEYGMFGPICRYSGLLRRVVSRPLFKESARIIGIGRGVDFGNGCSVIMKDHSSLGDYALVGDGRGTLIVGRHVMMGKRCTFILQNHKYLEEGYNGFEGGDIIIDDYAWIGHQVIILPGVRIGKHAIVGAGSVVTKDIPDYAVAGGNPAVIKKFRN